MENVEIFIVNVIVHARLLELGPIRISLATPELSIDTIFGRKNSRDMLPLGGSTFIAQ